jgi:hypothetical protein
VRTTPQVPGSSESIFSVKEHKQQRVVMDAYIFASITLFS